MNSYETLLSKVVQELPVLEVELLRDVGEEAIYENNYIYLDKNLSTIHKRIHLSEEFSHYKTSVGAIIDYTNPQTENKRFKHAEIRSNGLSLLMICLSVINVVVAQNTNAQNF